MYDVLNNMFFTNHIGGNVVVSLEGDKNPMYKFNIPYDGVLDTNISDKRKTTIQLHLDDMLWLLCNHPPKKAKLVVSIRPHTQAYVMHDGTNHLLSKYPKFSNPYYGDIIRDVQIRACTLGDHLQAYLKANINTSHIKQLKLKIMFKRVDSVTFQDKKIFSAKSKDELFHQVEVI